MSLIKRLILLVAGLAAKAFDADPDAIALSKTNSSLSPRRLRPRTLPPLTPTARH